MTNFSRDKNNKVNSFQVLKYFEFLALYTDLPNIPRYTILIKIDKKVDVTNKTEEVEYMFFIPLII